jgi:chitodextrinase
MPRTTNRFLLLLATVSALAACTGNNQPVGLADSKSQASTADTVAPSRPTGLSGTPMGSTGVSLSWSTSTDNIGVSAYVVSRNGAQIAMSATTSYVDSGLAAATTYSYSVAARDAAGNLSPNSASVSVTTAPAGGTTDTTPPSQPGGFTAVASGSSGANLSWNASIDNVGVTGYVLKRNGVQIATPTATTYSDTGLSAATTYTYTVAARDAAGNTSSAASASVTTTPTPPSNSAVLAWDAVVAPNLSGYRVYFGTVSRTYLQPLGQGVSVGNVTTYTVTGLGGATRYYFAVTATDSINDESAYSNEVFKDIP